MELSTFLGLFLGFYNLTSIHAPMIEDNNKTAPANLTNSAGPMFDNLAANGLLHVSENETITNNDNNTASAPTDISAATAVLAPVQPRDCCCHKEEPHHCDKSCQAFVIFALLSILLVAYLQANPVERKRRRRRRRRSLPSWQLRMLDNERPEWKSEWDTQMNRFYAEVVERTTYT